MGRKNLDTDTVKDSAELFDARVQLEKLPVDGKWLKLEFDEKRLLKLAGILKVSSVENFSAKLHVFSEKKGVAVAARLLATITQPCVVTLEPVLQQIDLTLSRTFVPAPRKRQDDTSDNSKKDLSEVSQIQVDFEIEDMPDEYEGHELDLSPFLLEELGLKIDLYPKAPGAKMSTEQAGDDPAELSAFAALKNLGKNQ